VYSCEEKVNAFFFCFLEVAQSAETTLNEAEVTSSNPPPHLVRTCHKKKVNTFIFLMAGTFSRQGPSDPPLQSKPRSRTPHPRKFHYTELFKSLAFHQDAWPQWILCTHKVLNLRP
jgi:hypothetical protein